MRILYLTAEPHPTFRVDIATLFGKQLPRHGIHTDLVTLADGSSPHGVAWPGGQALVLQYSGPGFLRHLAKGWHSLKTVLLASRKSYAAVQVRDMPFLACLSMVICRIKGMPFIYWMSFPIPEGQMLRAKRNGLLSRGGRPLLLWLRGYIGQQVLRKLVLPNATHVFAQSEAMKAGLVEDGMRADRVTPVPMGVDFQLLRYFQHESSDCIQQGEHRTLVYLGTLDPARQIEVLFPMLAKVRNRFPDINLLLVGDTTDAKHREWLKRKAVECGVSDHVVWTGWVKPEQAWMHVKTALVGLSPFPKSQLLDSASPTKVPEYLALGVPVVCNDNPDQEALINASGGGICAPYTAEAFAKAVETLLSEPSSSRTLRVELARQYIEKTRDYSVIGKSVAHAYTQIFNPAG